MGGVADFLTLGSVAEAGIGVVLAVETRTELSELGVFEGSGCKLLQPFSESSFFE